MVEFKWKGALPIREEVKKLIERGNITVEEWKNFRGNSAEYEAITPAMSDEALLMRVRHTLDNCIRSDDNTYDGSLKGRLLPEILKRYAAMMVKIGKGG